MWISTIFGWAVIIGIVCAINSWRKNNPDKPIIQERELTQEDKQEFDDMLKASMLVSQARVRNGFYPT